MGKPTQPKKPMAKNKRKLTQEDLEEFQSHLSDSINTHAALYKKVIAIRKDLIDQFLEILLIKLNKDKKVVNKNQLGVGISDEGIEIRIHLQSSSIVDYTIMKINWMGVMSIFKINDKLDIIDKIIPIIKDLFPQNS